MAFTASESGEAAGVNSTTGIAEIGRAAGEVLVRHRRPDGVGEACAGFNDDDQVAGPGNGEAELIRLHAEVLRLRVPKRSRTTAKVGPQPVVPGR